MDFLGSTIGQGKIKLQPASVFLAVAEDTEEDRMIQYQFPAVAVSILVYLEALKASETTEAPGIGLSTSSDKLSIPSGVKTLIRQNNTIIELCFLDFCREIPIPGYYKEPEKKYGVRKATTLILPQLKNHLLKRFILDGLCIIIRLHSFLSFES